jgi:hypothetical protein
MIMHLKPLDGLVVLNHRIKRFLLKLLPVPAQIVFGVRVEEKQEVLNIGNNFLELKVVAGGVELESLLLEFSHTVGSFFEGLSDSLVDLLLVELVFL